MKKYLLLVFSIMIGGFLFAQEENNDEPTTKYEYGEGEGDGFSLEDRQKISKPSMPFYDIEQPFNQKKKKKKKQQDAYLNREYYYPAKPKTPWQLGITGGLAMSNGDVKANFFRNATPFYPGYNYGLYVKKPLSYSFSLRLNYHIAAMYNTNAYPSTMTLNLRRNAQLTGYNLGDNIFKNSRTFQHTMILDAIYTIGNAKFHREQTRVAYNFYGAIGAMAYQTFYDHYDSEGNPYDYSLIPDYRKNADVSKSDVLSMLSDMRNGVYETPAEGHPREGSDAGIFDNYRIGPVVGLGIGMTIRMSKIVYLELETRQMFTLDDLHDGDQWDEPVLDGTAASSGLTTQFDTYNYTSVGLTFNLMSRKSIEPLTMINPFHYIYEKLMELDPEKAIEDFLQDDDNDGVPNQLDEEDDTPEGAPVDPSGRALDSDNDGIIDFLDKEPFSPPGYVINESGIAEVPAVNSYDCSYEELPSVHFEIDKYAIRPEFYAHLHAIAERAFQCDDAKIVVTGMTDQRDSDKHNEQLSWNRANAVVNYLTEYYSLGRDRFIVRYAGEKNAEGETNLSMYKDRKVTFKIANENDPSENMSEPHPGLKAGSEE